MSRVRFLPEGVAVEVPKGQTLLQAAARAGIILKGACGGEGVCGRCRVQVLEGRVTAPHNPRLSEQERQEGWVLACQALPVGEVTVLVPDSSRLSAHRVLKAEENSVPLHREPLWWLQEIDLDPPTLEDPTDDWGRLSWALERRGVAPLWISRQLLAELPGTLRSANWRLASELAIVSPNLYELQGLRPRGQEVQAWGLAVDIGTTTVAAELVDLASGRVVATAGTYNRQAAFGDDVISRIIHATEYPEGREELQQAALETINGLIEELCRAAGARFQDIRAVVGAGNTTMAHLLLNLDPTYIRLEPYVPAVNAPPPVKAVKLGLKTHPEAWLYLVPGVASYVGGDVVAGVEVTGMAEGEELTLLLDIGTNGEMVLGNRDWLLACACSAGPAFEGSGVTCGMRATAGAIEEVEVLPGGREVYYRTVEGKKPLGICGSGLISLLSSLLRAGVIDRSGRFVEGLSTPRLRRGEEGWEFVLVWARESAHGHDIYVTQGDLQNLLRAKAAVFAGLHTLLRAAGLEIGMLQRVYIAGGFGRFIDVDDAVAIGMLPYLPRERYFYVGNTSLKGARLCLLSRSSWQEVARLARRMTYVELSVGNVFMDEFMAALFLPHTNADLFAKEGA
ncbi:ASKHA domain-containing protein [Desulfothermobacter acidiphilus]|uniref:ASKHA domain-containing protein n=1 Tax=Desulfothermobacter acidiphilus TaxID=1938353 RepID=UPI003F8CF257